MTFEKKINNNGSYLEDIERKIVLQKKLGGQDFAVYELTVNDEKFLLNLKVNVTKKGTLWDFYKIDLPDGFDINRRDEIISIAKEAIEAVRAIFYRETRATKFISYSID
jgi:hypothetical protein